MQGSYKKSKILLESYHSKPSEAPKSALDFTPDNIDSLNREQLIALRNSLQRERLLLKDKLKISHDHFINEGYYDNKAWHDEAKSRSTFIGTEIARVSQKLAAIHRSLASITDESAGLTKEDWNGFHKCMRWLRMESGKHVKVVQ